MPMQPALSVVAVNNQLHFHVWWDDADSDILLHLYCYKLQEVLVTDLFLGDLWTLLVLLTFKFMVFKICAVSAFFQHWRSLCVCNCSKLLWLDGSHCDLPFMDDCDLPFCFLGGFRSLSAQSSYCTPTVQARKMGCFFQRLFAII